MRKSDCANIAFGNILEEPSRLRSKRERIKELARLKPKKEKKSDDRFNMCANKPKV